MPVKVKAPKKPSVVWLTKYGKKVCFFATRTLAREFLKENKNYTLHRAVYKLT